MLTSFSDFRKLGWFLWWNSDFKKSRQKDQNWKIQHFRPEKKFNCQVKEWLCNDFSFFFFFICSEFCHTLKWISHGFTCVPHPDSPSHLPLHPLPLGFPSAPGRALVSCIQPGLGICFTLDNIHVSMLFSWNIPPSPSPTESKRLFYKSVSFFVCSA